MAVLLLLGACRVPLSATTSGPSATASAPDASRETSTSAPPVERALGEGAAPGGERGPGGFVPRGTRRNFYAGAGGRLWYYMNNYYWVSETASFHGLWIEARVVEEFRDLKRWPDGGTVEAGEPKRTVEYWAVGPRGRSVRLDNHKDYCLLDDDLTAGEISVQVTLTLGYVEVLDDQGSWGRPEDNYVLAWRNYREDRGIGEDRVRFRPLGEEAVTVWGYRIPFSTHPQRLTRSSWQRLELPEWSLLERRRPPPPPARVVTRDEAVPEPALTPSEPADAGGADQGS